ncbi:MAG: hypothetical protein LBG58_03540 [Planctomycetaceae bacterium]|jgi:hypothetical protein|nr:hypothetical protein [Planctomycetaceae bacterium]
MRHSNWTKIGSIMAIIGVIVMITGIIVSVIIAVLTDNNNAKTKTISNIEQQTKISNPIINNQNNTQTVVVNPVIDRYEENKMQKIKTQIELYFLPFLSQKEFSSYHAASSISLDRHPQVYSDSAEVDGHTGKARVESYDIDNGELRISCAIPIYSDYNISETMKRKSEGRITDKDDLVASVIFIIRGDLKDIMGKNMRTKDILFISPAYNKDTGKWLTKVQVVKDAFESDFLQKYFTEFKPKAENK